MNPGRGKLRVWRGMTLAAASLVIPTVAHVAAGGGLPVEGPFLFGAALLAVACIGLADRQRSPGAIGGVVALTQPLLHGVLALSDHGAAAIVPTPGMILAHVAATLALTLLLIGGEAVLWSMAALARTVLGAVERVWTACSADVSPAAALHLSPVDLPRPSHLVLAAESLRRGPPAGAGI